MVSSIQAFGDEEIPKIIETFIEKYDMSVENLAHLLGTSVETIQHYGEAGTKARMTDEQKRILLIRLMLLFTMTQEDADTRLRSFIQVLTGYHKLSESAIAKFAEINEQEVSDFLNGSNTIPAENKYKLASAVMKLRFIFAFTEPAL